MENLRLLNLENFEYPLKNLLYALQASLIACLVTLFEILFNQRHSSVFFNCVNSFLKSPSDMNLPPFSSESHQQGSLLFLFSYGLKEPQNQECRKSESHPPAALIQYPTHFKNNRL